MPMLDFKNLLLCRYFVLFWEANWVYLMLDLLRTKYESPDNGSLVLINKYRLSPGIMNAKLE